MTIRRFYVDKSKINNNEVVIDEAEHNHLKNVLRLKQGDEIIVVCGDGFDYYASIKIINKTETLAQITHSEKNIYDPKREVAVYQALTKKDSMSLIVQKLTELGVSKIIPLETENTTSKDKINKTDKLQQISNQSIKQCKRSIPLKIENVKKIKEIGADFKNYDLVILANENEHSKSLQSILKAGTMQLNKVAIIVGSEGGFTVKECNELEKSGAKSVTLGKRILRAETATITLASIIMYELEELN